MNEIFYCVGTMKAVENLRKHYRAGVRTRNYPSRTRLLKRRFRTRTRAENYGKRFVHKWVELHTGRNITSPKKGRRIS